MLFLEQNATLKRSIPINLLRTCEVPGVACFTFLLLTVIIIIKFGNACLFGILINLHWSGWKSVKVKKKKVLLHFFSSPIFLSIRIIGSQIFLQSWLFDWV